MIGLTCIGLLAGTLGSLVGLGGGFIIVPLLTILFNLPSRLIAGTSTAVIVINSIASTWTYHGQRRIDWKSGLIFGAVAVPGSFFGARLSHHLSTHVFDVSFACLLIVVSLFLLFRPAEAKRSFFKHTAFRTLTDANGHQFSYSFNLAAGLVASFIVGFASSLFGIGGGSVMVPMMVLVLGFPAHIAGATSMLTVLISSIVGAGSHAMLGDILWLYALFLAIGALFGGLLGPRLAKRIPAHRLLRVLAVLMILTAIRLFW